MYQDGTKGQTRACYRCGRIERQAVVAPTPRDTFADKVTHRQFVGAEDRFDVAAAATFNLLTTLGLRERHRLLDIGCGSLRIGRLLITYLDKGNYVGFDPNRWLVKEGIKNETGADLIRIKGPRFILAAEPAMVDPELRFDYALASAIFIHMPMKLIRAWLEKTANCLGNNGALVATVRIGPDDYEGDDWVYPGQIHYRLETMAKAAADFGFRFQQLDWRLPTSGFWAGHCWVLFSKPGFDTSWFGNASPTWNGRIDSDPTY